MPYLKRRPFAACVECGKRYKRVRGWQRFDTPLCRFRYHAAKARRDAARWRMLRKKR
jgi:hypothetical protein